MRILMVCLGNICRSPIAQGIMQHLCDESDLNWEIESAGTNRYHTGEAPHPWSQRICGEHGINISTQRARTFTAEDMKRYDTIFVLAEDVMRDVQSIAGTRFDKDKVLYLTEYLYPGERKSITDPWYGNESGYKPVFLEIYACCEEILRQHSLIQKQ